MEPQEMVGWLRVIGKACEEEHAAKVELLAALTGLLATVDHAKRTGLCQGSEWVYVCNKAAAAIAEAKE